MYVAFKTIIMLIGFSAAVKKERSAGLISQDSGLPAPARPCKAEVLGKFLSAYENRSDEFAAAAADKQIKEYCPSVEHSCCSVADLQEGLKHFKFGVNQLNEHYNLIRLTVEAARKLGKGTFIDRFRQISSKAPEDIAEEIDGVFASLERIGLLVKALNVKLGSFYSGFICELCHPSAAAYFSQRELSSLLPPFTIIQLASENLTDLFAIRALNGWLIKEALALQSVMSLFAKLETIQRIPVFYTSEISAIEASIASAENCWQMNARGSKADGACLDQVRGQNLVFSFEGYDSIYSFMFVAEVLVDSFNVSPKVFKPVDLGVLSGTVGFFKEDPAQKTWDFSTMALEVKREGFDMNAHKLNPKLWSSGFVRTVGWVLALALLITAW